MASYTTNLNLKKPSGSENVAISDINGNMDTIDTAYGTVTSMISEHHIYIRGTDTWGEIWTKLTKLTVGDSATVFISGNAMKAISSNARSTAVGGNVMRGDTGSFHFITKTLNSNNNLVIAQISGASSSSPGTYTENVL